MDINEMRNSEAQNNEVQNMNAQNVDLMSGDFEADFFSPLPKEEPETEKKKGNKSNKGNKKVLLGAIAAVAVVAVAAIVILVVTAVGKSPKDRFIKGMEALMDELKNPGPSWQEEVDYEVIANAIYTEPVSIGAELNLTVPDQLTVGVDILHDSDYPNKLSNTNVAVSVYNIPLIEADITLDEDMWYIGLPDLLEEIYSVNGATLGKDYNASDWAYDYFGLLLVENYAWEGFTGLANSDEVNVEFYGMISEGIHKIKENMVVEEEEKPELNGKFSANDYLRVVLKKEDINNLMKDIFEFYEENGYMEAQELAFPDIADDIEILVALDKKDRIVAIYGQEPVAFEEDALGEWAYEILFTGKEEVTDHVVLAYSMAIDEASTSVIMEYDRTEEDGVYGNELSVIVSVDDGEETAVLEIGFEREWNQADKKFKDLMEMTMDGETYSVEIKGSFKDIVAGEQFTMDLSKLAVYSNDTELIKVTGEVSIAPFHGEIDVPEEHINIFDLSEAEMEALMTGIVDAIYAKVLGE